MTARASGKRTVWTCRSRLHCLALAVLIGCVVAIVPLSGQIASPLFSNEKSVLKVRTVDGAETSLKVVTVSSGEDLSRGLMHVQFMPLDQGMLFHYGRERGVSMWMKNTRLSLDMWFVDKQGTVTKVVASTEPMSLDSIPSDGPVQAVVEVNAGISALVGVTPGASLFHEAFRNAANETTRN